MMTAVVIGLVIVIIILMVYNTYLDFIIHRLTHANVNLQQYKTVLEDEHSRLLNKYKELECKYFDLKCEMSREE